MLCLAWWPAEEICTAGGIRSCARVQSGLETCSPYSLIIFRERAGAFSSWGCKTALDDFDETIRLLPELTVAYLIRSQIHAFLGQAEKALNDLNVVLDIEPSNIVALLERGSIYAALGNWNQVVKDSTAVIEQDKENVQAWGMRAVANQNIANYKQALEDWNQVERLKGPSLEIFKPGNILFNQETVMLLQMNGQRL